MPLIRSAKKKLRKDIKRTKLNASRRALFKAALKQARKNPTKQTLAKLSSTLDKAVKTNFIHKNKASRLKSRAAALQSRTSKLLKK